jgi:hypothetical protein
MAPACGRRAEAGIRRKAETAPNRAVNPAERRIGRPGNPLHAERMSIRAVVPSVIACLLAVISVLVLPSQEIPSWRASFSPRLVEPSGGNDVGVRRMRVETGADDPWNPGSPRVVMVDIHYPAVAGEHPLRQYQLARYLTEEAMLAGAPDRERRLGLRAGEVNWMFTTHSHEWAPVREGQFPAVVISASQRGVRTSLTSLAEDLASHGLIVVTVDHPYDAPLVDLWPTREVVDADDAERELTGRAADAARAADVAAVADRLATLDEEIEPAIAPRCVVVLTRDVRDDVAAATDDPMVEAQISARYPRTAEKLGALPSPAQAERDFRARSADVREVLAERLTKRGETCL